MSESAEEIVAKYKEVSPHQLAGRNTMLVNMIKEYAKEKCKEKCKEQREICAMEADYKEEEMHNTLEIDRDSIRNSPEPEFN